MFPDNKDVIVFEDAKTFIPLEPAFQTLGLQLVASSDLGKLASLDRVLCYFSCFYRCLDHPFSAWHRRIKLSRAGIPTVTWNRDAPHYLNRPKWQLNLACRLRFFDIYATHTLIDAKKYSFAPTTIYLANAVEPSIYSPPLPLIETYSRLRDESTYAVDVSFFGGMDGTRYKEDADRARFFLELSARLKEENISHDFRETGGMTPSQQIAFILSSKINLNYGARCEYKTAIASGLPERCFGIPGSGGFLLCDKRTHSHDDFNVGQNWAEYSGIEDCVTQIKYWLANFQLARNLAEKCHDHVVEKHTYQHRAETLLQALYAWYA